MLSGYFGQPENHVLHLFIQDTDLDKKAMMEETFTALEERNEKIKLVKHSLGNDATINIMTYNRYNKLCECERLLMEADNHYNSFRLNEAIEHAKIALDIANKCDFVGQRVVAYEGLALYHERLGCVKDVIRYYNEMIHWSERSGDKVNEGRAYKFLAIFHLQRTFNLEEAARCAEKRLELANEREKLDEKACAYDAIGMVRNQQGKFDEAKEYHLKSLDIAKYLKDVKSEYVAYFNLGDAASSLGQNYDAIQYFSQSIRLMLQMSGAAPKENLGAALLRLGEVHKQIGDFKEAIKSIKQAIQISRETNDLPAQFIRCTNLAKIYEYTGDNSKTLEYSLLGIIIAFRIGDQRGKMYYYQLLGNWFLHQNHNNKAIQYHKRSVDIALNIEEYSSIVCAYVKLARTYEALDMFTDQIKLTEELLKIATKHGDKNFQARCLEFMAIAFQNAAHQNEQDHYKFTQFMKQAEKYQRKCVHQWDQFFGDLGDKKHCKLSISDRYLSSRTNLSSILVKTGQVLEALVVSETGRACILKDTLTSKYKIDYKATELRLRGPEKLIESEVFNLVPSKASVVFYCFSFTDNYTLMWVLSKTDRLIINFVKKKLYQKEIISPEDSCIRHFAYIYALVIRLHQTIVSAGRKSTADCEDRSLRRCPSVIDGYDSRTLQSHLDEPQDSSYIDGFQPTDADNLRNPRSLSQPCDVPKKLKHPLKALYNEFIAPVQEHLTQDETLIVPEGILHYVPFAALQDPETGRFLCERTRIRLTPSLAVLKHLNDCPIDFHCDQGALVIGNPSVGEVMFRGERKTFANLPAAELEARVFSSILGVSPLTQMAATKDAVKEKLKEGASVIHIAAHGDDSTGEIALAPGTSAQSKSIPEEEDYILTMQEVQEIGVRAKLVVLSCCHSGCGEIRAEGVIGMARAFLAAGARAVVASLWAINDHATLDFMSSFYTSLRLGKSASVSLNEAMNDQIQGREYSKPKYWAPFVLIGDNVTIWP